jgi:hypothetical protein
VSENPIRTGYVERFAHAKSKIVHAKSKQLHPKSKKCMQGPNNECRFLFEIFSHNAVHIQILPMSHFDVELLFFNTVISP